MPKKPILVSFNIKIYIEALEISYKFCDEFGLFFRPYLQFFFYDQLETIKIFNKLTNHNLHYEDLNKSAEIIENLSFGSKFSEKKVIINGKENSYSFKSVFSY